MEVFVTEKVCVPLDILNFTIIEVKEPKRVDFELLWGVLWQIWFVKERPSMNSNDLGMAYF